MRWGQRTTDNVCLPNVPPPRKLHGTEKSRKGVADQAGRGTGNSYPVLYISSSTLTIIHLKNGDWLLLPRALFISFLGLVIPITTFLQARKKTPLVDSRHWCS